MSITIKSSEFNSDLVAKLFTISQFKEFLRDEAGIELDFRKHVFLENSYGATPCVKYDFAEVLVTQLYKWAQECVEENPNLFPNFGGFEYNLQMSCEMLRTQRIRLYIEYVVDTLNCYA